MFIKAAFALAMFSALSNPAHAQDERFWRRMLLGDVGKENKKVVPEPKYVFVGAVHQLDLTGDGIPEGLRVTKRDLLDGVEVLATGGDVLWSGNILPTGVDARIEKFRLVRLSPQVTTLILYYYEGKTSSSKLEATGRLWFLTWTDGKLRQASLTAGPRYWHEFEKVREQYGRRRRAVNVQDFDHDGVKDVIVSYHHTMSVWRFVDGAWQGI
jgi:hypothetical protein